MAKCPVCNSRKGKRKCIIEGAFICSLCCGNIRTKEACSECGFFQEPTRKYNQVPAFTVSEMDGNDELESYGNSIEGGLCAFDIEHNGLLKDKDAIKIVERLMDKYHFQDGAINETNTFIIEGFNYIDDIISKDLNDLDNEVIVKLLGVIRFVAKRRTNIGREYMNIIHQYIGRRAGPGIRILRQ